MLGVPRSFSFMAIDFKCFVEGRRTFHVVQKRETTIQNLNVFPGSIMFHVRRRPADYHPRKRKKKPQQRLEYRYEDSLPYFMELNPGKKIENNESKHGV